MKELLKQLVRVDTTAGKGEAQAADVVAAYFEQHGLVCAVERWDGDRANVTAHVKSAGNRPGLMFVCHLDVVGPGDEAWRHPPFGAVEVDGRIYGRGTTDMKGGTAAIVAAICDLVDSGAQLQGDIVFSATAGEETDSVGALRLMENRAWMPPLAGIVIPEPTDFCVVTAHRGMLWLKITTRGKAVHSSMPERGLNAIAMIKHVLDALERYEVAIEPHPMLGPCSKSVNTIVGGEAMNVVPDRCTIGVDFRTLPGQNHEALRCDIERLLANLRADVPGFEADLAVERSVAAMETHADNAFVKAFCEVADVDMVNAVGFTTDAPHLAPLGAPIVIYGPGKPGLCHQVDEFVEIADLEQATDVFKRVVERFLT
jgi:succinyl-diaminopimelate desuccinylase